jgi:protoheme IX farnesyltransferase
MLPVTRGAAETRRQILIYSLVMAPVGMLPALTGLGGTGYAVTAAVGGATFVVCAAALARSKTGDEGAPLGPARRLFGFSIVYLFSLFAALLIEHAFGLNGLGDVLNV